MFPAFSLSYSMLIYAVVLACTTSISALEAVSSLESASISLHISRMGQSSCPLIVNDTLSYFALKPTFHTNVLDQYCKVLKTYEFRTAEIQSIFAKTDLYLPSSNIEDFQSIRMVLKINETNGIAYTTDNARWGIWRDSYVKSVVYKSRGSFDPWDLKIDIDEAARIMSYAGYKVPWKSVQILKLLPPDPFYAKGQPYYVFVASNFDKIAVGAINRLVVRDFPYPTEPGSAS